MNRKKSVSEKALERYFSIFIRLRDSDVDGYGNCCTCGKRMHYSQAQAGHFITRDRKATKYDERNVNFQCPRCNKQLKGDQYNHSRYIDAKYGPGTAEEIRILSLQPLKRTKQDVAELREYYKGKVELLQSHERNQHAKETWEAMKGKVEEMDEIADRYGFDPEEL